MTMTEHRIRCGTCAAGEHETVAEVRACATGSAETAQERADKLPIGNYEKNGQRFRVREGSSGHKYAMMLNPANGHYDYVPGSVKTLTEENLVARTDNHKGRELPPEPAEGIHRHPETGEILKVYRTVHGSNRLCAKRLVVEREGSRDEGLGFEGHFEYLGLAINYIDGHEPLSLEEALEFGRLYGVCVRCGRTLTDEESIARGIGPDCAAKGWAA